MREHSETSGIATSSPGITRGRKGWGSYGSKGSLAKALSRADPRTLKKKKTNERRSLRNQRKQFQSWQSSRGPGRRGAI